MSTTDNVKNKVLSDLIRSKSKLKKISLWCGGLICLLFPIYLFVLYQKLETTFQTVNEFIPTRLYSDVYRISLGIEKREILRILNALQYKFKENDGNLQIVLHPLDYPTTLLPDGNPTIELASKEIPIDLHFDESNLLTRVSAGSSENPTYYTFPPEDESGSPLTRDRHHKTAIYLEPELIATFGNTDGTRLIRDPIPLTDVPAPLWQAIIAVEDPRFLIHPGIDWRGIARAIWVNLKTLSFAQGGSTLTLQLVKNLNSRRTKNIFAKFNELFLAILLEWKYSKEEILERYLNEIFLGQVGAFEVHGVAEGARYFFDKNLSDLNLAEMALIAGVIRGPSYYSPYRNKEEAIRRQRFVIKRMVETGQISQEESELALKTPLQFAPVRQIANRAPYFSDYVKAKLADFFKGKLKEEEIAEAGLRVYTTLHIQLNSVAQKKLKEQTEALQKNLKLTEANPLEGASAIVEHKTGYIRSLVGGRDYSLSTFNRILNMKRQVGSTFKPLVYLNALLKAKDTRGAPFGPAYPVFDGPWTYTYEGQKWSPKNYEKEFSGWTTMRFALGQSINTVAAKLGVATGLDDLVRLGKSLGIQSEMKPFPSLTLGAVELNPIELLQVYSIFANDGLSQELTVIRSINQRDGTSVARFVPEVKETIPSAAAKVLTSMMEATFTIGTARSAAALGFNAKAFGKTGTTSDYRDAWFAGTTGELTSVVWVGFDKPGTALSAQKGKKSPKLTGAGSALPIWVGTMKEGRKLFPDVDQNLNPGEFTKPEQTFTKGASEENSSEIQTKRIRIDLHSGFPATTDCPDAQVTEDIYPQFVEELDTTCAPDYLEEGLFAQ